MPNNRRLTYAEFDGLVRRLANGLRGLGLEKGDRFGVLSRNCAEFMALYFAAGRAGLVLQPLNWRLAGEELATIVRDASPKVIISQDEFGEAIEQLQRDVDVPNWLQFGDKSDGSFTRFVESASDEEPDLGPVRCATTTRSSSSTPAGPPGRARAPCTPTAARGR